MRSNWFLCILAAILGLLQPVTVYGLNSCESLFGPSPAVSRLEKLNGWVSISEAKRGVSDSSLSAALLAEMRGVLQASHVAGGTTLDAKGNHVDHVSADTTTPLNRLALSLETSYGAHVVSYPAKLVEMGAQGAVILMTHGRGVPEPTLVIGPSLLAQMVRGRNIMRDPILLHEIRHLKIAFEIRMKIPNAFYGEVTAVRGQIPGLATDFRAYQKGLSFSECKTYHQQLKQELVGLRRVVRRQVSAEDLREAIDKVSSSATYGYVVSLRSNHVASMIKDFITDSPATAKFEVDELGLLQGRIGVKSDDFELQMRIPLLGSSGVHDAKNIELLKKQLGQLEHGSSVALSQFAQVGQLIEQHARDGTLASVELIDRLQTMLSPSALTP